MEFMDVIRKRRSVRKYTGEPIPRNDLKTIVDAGRMAASGSNHQPWTFVVVTEPDVIAEIAPNNWSGTAGAMIAVVVDKAASSWWHEDASAAVQNMLLAATALGYGSCWLEGQTRRKMDVVRQALIVPEDRHLVTLVSIGVPVAWPSVEKRALDEVIRWERFS